MATRAANWLLHALASAVRMSNPHFHTVTPVRSSQHSARVSSPLPANYPPQSITTGGGLASAPSILFLCICKPPPLRLQRLRSVPLNTPRLSRSLPPHLQRPDHLVPPQHYYHHHYHPLPPQLLLLLLPCPSRSLRHPQAIVVRFLSPRSQLLSMSIPSRPLSPISSSLPPLRVAVRTCSHRCTAFSSRTHVVVLRVPSISKCVNQPVLRRVPSGLVFLSLFFFSFIY